MTDRQQNSYIVPNSPKISHKKNGYKESVSQSHDDDKDCGGEATLCLEVTYGMHYDDIMIMVIKKHTGSGYLHRLTKS